MNPIVIGQGSDSIRTGIRNKPDCLPVKWRKVLGADRNGVRQESEGCPDWAGMCRTRNGLRLAKPGFGRGPDGPEPGWSELQNGQLLDQAMVHPIVAPASVALRQEFPQPRLKVTPRDPLTLTGLSGKNGTKFNPDPGFLWLQQKNEPSQWKHSP